MNFYTFQELTAEDILTGLADAKIKATPAMLNQPKPVNVYSILKSFFIVISNFEESELARPHLVVDECPDRELAGGYAFLNFFRGMKDLMRASGIKDFSFQDLYKPNSQRFQHLLSGLISFAIFREDRVRTFTEHNRRATELKNENIEIANEIKRVEQSIAERAQMLEGKRQENEMLKSSKIALENQLNEIQDSIEYLRNTLNNLERETQEIQRQINSTKGENEMKRDQINKLNEMMSLSPNTVEKKEKELDENYENEMREVERCEEKLNYLKQRHKMLGNVRTNLIDGSDKLYQFGKNRMKLMELNKKKELLESDKQIYQGKIETLQKLRNKRDEYEAKQKQEANERRDIVSKIKEYKRALQKLEDDHKNRMKYDINDKIESLRRKIQEYKDNLNRAMNEFEIQNNSFYRK